MAMMNETELFRNNPAIDPSLHIWGWEIPVYLFLGGVAAGVMILAAMIALRSTDHTPSRWMRLLPFAAPLLISVGMLALLLDLAYKLHVFRFYLTVEWGSPMSWGSWILVGIYPSTLLLGMALLSDDDAAWLADWRPIRMLRLPSVAVALREWCQQRLSTLAWTNVVLGIALGAYTGMLLGTLAARPAWNSLVLAPLFLASGISTGAAFMMLFPLPETEHGRLRRWDLLAIGAEAVLLVLFLLSLGVSGGSPGSAAAASFLGGAYTAPFFTLVVLAGLVVPFTLSWLESRRRLNPTIMAPVLVLIGGLALRFIIVLAGQAA